MDTFLTVLSWTTPPIVGALIGYATNRIAIRMLFRPLQEKHLFGWRLPLTPGVIPRHREALAANIGAVVGGELLSEDAIRDYVDEPEFRTALERVMRVNFLPNPLLRRLREPLIGLLVGRVVALRNRIEVDKLIENRVNQYNVHAMEGMILSVTQQHLRWISWFGAVLGALIGCLQLVLNVLS